MMDRHHHHSNANLGNSVESNMMSGGGTIANTLAAARADNELANLHGARSNSMVNLNVPKSNLLERDYY